MFDGLHHRIFAHPIPPHPTTATNPPSPTRNRTNAKAQLSAKTAQYRNQISTLLGASPLSFHFKNPFQKPLPKTPFVILLPLSKNKRRGNFRAQ